mmetsp:Transcript_19715/g.54833  ORF Transcript_19715/g.54833 Transcript_19715/m.54833 type:complete len:99 (-) Transcript_19715:1400-1696(-)
MAHQARSSGSKIVAAAIAGTFGAVGIGTIYLPFVADRDKMRGLHEEKDAPTSVMLAAEIKKLQSEGLLRKETDEDNTVNIPTNDGARKSNSMWSRFSK